MATSEGTCVHTNIRKHRGVKRIIFSMTSSIRSTRDDSDRTHSAGSTDLAACTRFSRLAILSRASAKSMTALINEDACTDLLDLLLTPVGLCVL